MTRDCTLLILDLDRRLVIETAYYKLTPQQIADGLGLHRRGVAHLRAAIGRVANNVRFAWALGRVSLEQAQATLPPEAYDARGSLEEWELDERSSIIRVDVSKPEQRN